MNPNGPQINKTGWRPAVGINKAFYTMYKMAVQYNASG